MIAIEFSGYVKNPEIRKTQSGKVFHCYGVRTKCGKNLVDGTPKYTFLNVRDHGVKEKRELGNLPEANSFVRIKGAYDVDEVEKDGKKQRYITVFAHELTVSPPREDSAEPAPSTVRPGAPDLSWMEAE